MIPGSATSWRNWAGNVSCKPLARHVPPDEAALASVLRSANQAGQRVKLVGAGHSCSAIAAAEGAHLVSLDRLDRLIDVDRASGHVTVGAGIRLRELNRRLAEHGLALPNLGVIDEQSLAGAIATGTHGTGLHLGSLASRVVGLTLMRADGELVEASGDLLQAAAVGLGALGAVVRVTLACVPAFNLRVTEGPATLDETLDGLAELQRAERFGFWWFPHTDHVRRWRAETTDAPADPPPGPAACWHDEWVMNRGHEAALALAGGTPGLVPAINRAFAGAFFAREKSWVAASADAFRLTVLVRQRVMEYAVPYEATAEALRGLRALIEGGGHQAHWPVDVRFTASDEAWLSPAHGRPTCFIGVIAYRPFGADVPWEPYFHETEALMKRLGGRPHWGKLHWRTAADLAPLYPRWADFLAVRDRLDPDRRFANAYLERVLGP